MAKSERGVRVISVVAQARLRERPTMRIHTHASAMHAGEGEGAPAGLLGQVDAIGLGQVIQLEERSLARTAHAHARARIHTNAHALARRA